MIATSNLSRGAFLIVTLAVSQFAAIAFAQAGRAKPAAAAPQPLVLIEAQRSDEVIDGSGFVVNEGTAVVTTLGWMRDAPRLRCKFSNGELIDVAGYLSALVGKDLVLLKLKRPIKGVTPVEFSDAKCAVGDEIKLLTALPLPASPPVFHIKRLWSGDEITEGLDPRDCPTGFAPDARWMQVDVRLPWQFHGAPAVRDGKLVGVVSELPQFGFKGDVVIHAWHVRALLSLAKKSASSLTALAKHQDPVAEGPAAAPAPPAFGGPLAHRDQPLAARWREFAEQDMALASLKDDLAEQQRTAKLDLDDLTARFEAMQVQANGHAREIRHIENNPEHVKKTKTVKDKATGKETEEVEYELSDRQKKRIRELQAAYDRLDREARQVHAQADKIAAMSAATNKELDHWSGHVQRQRQELFQLMDPSEEHCAAQFAAALPIIDEQTKGIGEHEALLHLARGFALERLGKLDDASAEFERGKEIDAKLRPTAELAQARAMIRSGRKSDGQAIADRAIRQVKNDPLGQIMAGLVQASLGNFRMAEARFKAAQQAGGDAAELHRLLALIYAASPATDVRNGAKATKEAQAACELTNWRHWPSLLALAAACAESDEFEEAAEWADKAAKLCDGDDRQKCLSHKSVYEESKALRLVW